MKRSETRSPKLVYLALFVPFALIIPNLILDFTEINMSIISGIVNVFFPLSVYYLIVSVFRKTGLGVLCCFPFMLFAAFQIVLLYLYGESIIAVDMFLNVATTDFLEAGTLLGNLMPAIIAVIVLYLPTLVWAIISMIKKMVIPQYPRLVMLSMSIIGTVVFGLLLLGVSLGGYCRLGKDIFPINVINNCALAVKRGNQTAKYPGSAKNFTYGATDADSTRRIVALVIGETARPDRWSLFGAERQTNPRLSKRSNLYTFQRAITQSNTTHKSVPLLMTPLTAETFDSLNYYKSIITAFSEAGFQTTWITNQPPNGAYNEHMGKEADSVMVFKYAPDVDLVANVEDVIRHNDPSRSQFIVFHTYGGHFPYDTRYDGIAPVFTPDHPMIATKSNRQSLLNAYDNAMVATDLAIDSIITMVSKYSDDAVVVYAADHGEDIFDDDRGRFLHASPAPTVYQLRVPMMVWLSDNFESRRGVGANLADHKMVPFSPSVSFFHTLIDLGGIKTPYSDDSLSLASGSFNIYPLMYLTDTNEAVPVEQSGLRKADMIVFDSLGIVNFCNE